MSKKRSPDPLNYLICEARYNNGETELADDTWIIKEERNGIVTYGVKFYNTVILRFYSGGIIEYNSGGYRTYTTRDRMNRFGASWIKIVGNVFRVNTIRDGKVVDEFMFHDGLIVKAEIRESGA